MGPQASRWTGPPSPSQLVLLSGPVGGYFLCRVLSSFFLCPKTGRLSQVPETLSLPTTMLGPRMWAQPRFTFLEG